MDSRAAKMQKICSNIFRDYIEQESGILRGGGGKLQVYNELNFDILSVQI